MHGHFSQARDELLCEELLGDEIPELKKSISVPLYRIDDLVENAVFGADILVKEECQQMIRELAATLGIFPASIQGLYEAAGDGLYRGITVPAVNIRGITYQVARAAFRAALKDRVGAFIFEIARSEMGYTRQRPGEYATCVLAAAIKEGYKGPVFLQGDHFQVNQTKYSLEPDKELNAIKELIQESVNAGFLNIDVDASTLVDLKEASLGKQQAENYLVTADMTRFIRDIEAEGITISVGGEIGEVGKRNSTVEELEAFMQGYLSRLGPNVKGISKISVQTGTTHGGVVMPDGSMARVELDFETLQKLSKAARSEYGMGGAVQHGASTLPDWAFGLFPQVGAVEVHLATGFQNLIYDHPYFPKELLNDIYGYLLDNYIGERKPGETDEQFFYRHRKRGFGIFKKQMWGLPEENLRGIREALENRFSSLFHRLNVVETVDLVNKFVFNSFTFDNRP
jgi:fructose/tagatose bisphosphate aldolase